MSELTIKIALDDQGRTPGKLAEAELHFTSGPLEGMKLIGFSVWERRGGSGKNVTFPARSYSVNGERRSFSLLRPIDDTASQDLIRQCILDAYETAVRNLEVDKAESVENPQGWARGEE